MNGNYATTTQEIKSIDLFISDSNSAFADISIDSSYIYYCIGTEDTREDGRINSNAELLDELRRIFAQSANENIESPDTSRISLKLRLTLTTGEKIDIKTNAAFYACGIIRTLAMRYDEFLFVDNFRRIL